METRVIKRKTGYDKGMWFVQINKCNRWVDVSQACKTESTAKQRRTRWLLANEEVATQRIAKQLMAGDWGDVDFETGESDE